MKYTSDLNYTSPITKLLSKIQNLDLLKGFNTLSLFVESLIEIDERKFKMSYQINKIEMEIKNHKSLYSSFSSEQFELSYDDNRDGLNNLENEITKIKVELSEITIKSATLKRTLKSEHPNLWCAYLDLKEDYGKEKYSENILISGTLKCMTDELLNVITLFTNYHSFGINHFVSMQNKINISVGDCHSEMLHKFLNKEINETFKREELKKVPVHLLMNIVNQISPYIINIKKEDINIAITKSNLTSEKKQFKKLLNTNFNIDFLNQFWKDIKNVDTNNKLLTIN